MKGKVYKKVVRSAMMFGLETEALIKRPKAELDIPVLKMLKCSLGVMRMERIKLSLTEEQTKLEKPD